MTRSGTRERVEGQAPDVLADAVERVRELSVRLWAVRAEHPPVRGLLGRLRCSTCGEPHPCRTSRVASGLLAS